MQYISDLVQNNQMVQAVIVAAPITALTYTARNLPIAAWSWIKRMFTYEVVFRSDNADYVDIAHFIMENMINEKWSRKFAYDSRYKYNKEINEEELTFSGISIGYGSHWGSYQGTPVIVTREFTEDNQSSVFKETLTVKFVTLSPNKPKMMAEEILKSIKKVTTEDRIEIYANTASFWTRVALRSKRNLDTVFTNDDQGTRLLEHIRAFEASRDDTIAQGLPWHTGILLTGPPGTGKSALIHAIASMTGRKVYFLNLSAVDDDEQLTRLMAERIRWDKALLILEDFDATRADTDRHAESKSVALATMLNILDGLLTPEGLVTIATTNHPEKLDPALVRSGRFDLRMDLKALEWDQFLAMGRLIRGTDRDLLVFKNVYRPLSGAILRERLMAESLIPLFNDFLH